MATGLGGGRGGGGGGGGGLATVRHKGSALAAHARSLYSPRRFVKVILAWVTGNARL